MVRMISHDLRTPLNAVYTQAHLLQRSADARTQERGRSIVRSCERMNGMIQDLVETTLLEAGQLRLQRSAVDLRELVSEVLERLRGGLEVDRIQVSCAPGLPCARADGPRIERLLVNLLSNALKYSPPQSAVQVRLELAGPGEVALAVCDRGIGIAPEDLPRIFDRYFRAAGARRPEGLGLGLYIARRVTEAHGGRISVESQLGQGSTFRVVLPAAPELAEQAAQA
ncbi:MAG: ATP-binding protein [Anaeromyxobacter sp.]